MNKLLVYFKDQKLNIKLQKSDLSLNFLYKINHLFLSKATMEVHFPCYSFYILLISYYHLIKDHSFYFPRNFLLYKHLFYLYPIYFIPKQILNNYLFYIINKVKNIPCIFKILLHLTSIYIFNLNPPK